MKNFGCKVYRILEEEMLNWSSPSGSSSPSLCSTKTKKNSTWRIGVAFFVSS